MVACQPCRHCPRRGACLLCRLPALPLACFPTPPAPFPDGEGGAPKFISPGASPPAPLHLTAYNTYRLCHASTLAGDCLFTTRIPDAQREPTLLQGKEPAPSGHRLRSASLCRPGSALGDARGKAPCIRKQKISPFPAGEERSASAGGGMGAEKQAKGRAGGRQGRQAAPQGTAGAGRSVRKKANA